MALWLVGCEVIDMNERLVPVEMPSSGARTHVLIEFTGFRCVNCPKAAETAQALQASYGEQLILVAMHPASNPFTQGKYDYTCPAADSIYQWMGGTASTPFPTGNIDMVQHENAYFSDPTEWASILHQAMTDTVAPDLSGAQKWYWLVEDSVQGVQAMPDGSVNKNYYHRHVLRGAWTDEAQVIVPAGCNREQLFLLTLYTDTNDKHILQAYEKKLDSGSAQSPFRSY